MAIEFVFWGIDASQPMGLGHTEREMTVWTPQPSAGLTHSANYLQVFNI